MQRLEDIKELMSVCVEAGYQRAVASMLPMSDKMRKKKAEEYLRCHGFQKVMLSRWVSEGLVHEHKGERNSPIWYSMKEITETIMAIRYKKIIV